MYADFFYYSQIYGGTIIVSEEDMATYERKARRLIDSYTFGRVTEKTTIPEAVKDCVCELAEAIKLFDDTAHYTEGGIIASQSNDGVSVTYDASALSFEKHNKKLYAIIQSNLANTGLIYRGL